MAQQLAKRFPVKQAFSSLTELLDEARPEVVHITTPPQSHFDLAKTCLDRGCHVYVEKPFTVWADEARELIAIANEKRLKVTAGHDDQFSHVSRRMRIACAQRISGRVACSHGELLLLRNREDRLRWGVVRRQRTLGNGDCRENFCRTSSVMALPGLQSS